jgi:hypothetical protein
VARDLDPRIALRGRPLSCVSENGTELTSMAILRWRQAASVNGITSLRESRSRMPSANPSTAD